MRSLRPSLAAAALALALPAGSVEPPLAAPRQGATTGFSVSARVVSGLGLRKTADLELGAVSIGESGGSISVSPDDGLRRVTGDVSAAASSYGAARFALSGGAADPSKLRISLPDRVALVGARGETLTARSFTGRLVGSGGAIELVVGATVDVSGGQPAGRYRGTFAVTVNES